MNNEVIDSQVNNICEAYDCFQKATTKINVKVGQLGSICLDLCTYCARKFDGKDQVEQVTRSIRENTKNEYQRNIV